MNGRPVELKVGMRVVTEDASELLDDYRLQHGYVADIEVENDMLWVVFDDPDLNTNDVRTDKAMFITEYHDLVKPEEPYVIQEWL